MMTSRRNDDVVACLCEFSLPEQTVSSFGSKQKGVQFHVSLVRCVLESEAVIPSLIHTKALSGDQPTDRIQ